MYCPRCAAQNLDDAKYCRACGTNLETVALALAGKRQLADAPADRDASRTWIEERREGISKIVRGTGLLGSSLLIGIALGLFSNQKDWIIVWMIFTGWMACWGIFSMVTGIANLMESRFLRRQLESDARMYAPSDSHRQIVTGELLTPVLPAPRSVTEHTTRSLSQERSKPAS